LKKSGCSIHKGADMAEDTAKAAQIPAAQAWKDLRYFASAMRGILALEQVLTEVGSIERHAVAAQDRLDKLRAECEAAEAALEKSKADAAAMAAEARQGAETVLSKANAKAREIVDRAASQRVAADEVLAKAQEKAEAIKQAAKDEIAAGKAKIKDEIELLEKGRHEAQYALKDKQAELKALQADIAKAQQEKEALRASMSSLLQGLGK
jgi:predicted  nucleic acid-binding Zn-ribbon protein